jgi:hypothetical protein
MTGDPLVGGQLYFEAAENDHVDHETMVSEAKPTQKSIPSRRNPRPARATRPKRSESAQSVNR